MARPVPKRESDDNAAITSFVSSYSPLHIAVSLLRRWVIHYFPFRTSFRIASRLAPLLVCLSLIPLVLLFSLFSGWYIWKNIPVAWQVPIYLQYGDGPLPYAELSLPALSTSQPYDISLHLALPASEANFALGNFMATLSLSTSSNKTLVSVSKPAIALPPKPAIIPFSTTPRLIDLDIPLLSSYVPVTSRLNARINLGRKDGWRSIGNGEGRELSVLDAVLRGTVKRHGIWGLVSRFPLTFALAASAAFFSLSVITLAACILPAIQWRVSTDETPAVSVPREDRPTRKRPRSRTAYKSEDVPVDIPSAHGLGDFPLRRRRSRMSDVLLDSEN